MLLDCMESVSEENFLTFYISLKVVQSSSGDIINMVIKAEI